MCLFISSKSDGVNVRWVQEFILTEPGRGVKGEVELVISGAVSSENDGGKIDFLHRGFLWDIKNKTKDWADNEDWVMKLTNEKLKARKIDRTPDGKFNILLGHEIIFLDASIGPQLDPDDIEVWPNLEKAHDIKKHSANLPFTWITLKNFKKGNALFRIAFRTEFGIKASERQRWLEIEGPKTAEDNFATDIKNVNDASLKEELWKIFCDALKYNERVVQKYDVVLIGHPLYDHTLVKAEKGNLADVQEIEQWPGYSFNTPSLVHIFNTPDDMDFKFGFSIHLTEEALEKDNAAQLFAGLGLLGRGGVKHEIPNV